jgi:outer membrane receptor protein involved in Fe transport
MGNLLRAYRIAALLLLVSSMASADTRPVSGIVVDESTGAPVAGARIEVINGALSVLTDARGRFAFERLPITFQSLRAAADGYEAALVDLATAMNGSAGLTIALRPQLRFEEAVVVAAGREEASRTSVPRSVSVLTAGELARRAPRTTAEAIADLPGVLVQKTNHGGGSPYIRGLVGNHVLVLIDGVRLNNATFRYGPNQYLATIDPGQIDRIEVLRGSGSVLFGSDAIGGVINIVTRRPALSADGVRVSGVASAKAVSSGMERSGRFELMASGGRAGVLAGVSLRDYGHLRAGGDLGVEAPSAYSEMNGDARALVRLSSRQSLEIAFQQVYQDDVPRFDQVAQRGFALYSFDPQVRRLSDLRWQRAGAGPWLRTVTARVSYHQSEERRRRQQRGSPVLVVEQDDVAVASTSIEVRSAPAPFWSVVSGIDYTHDSIGSWRRDTDLVSGTVHARRGLYPDGANASSIAVFTHSSLRFDRTTLEGGLRWNQYGVSARDASFGDLEIRPRAWVGSLAVMHALNSGVQLVGSVSQGFRAPNVDDVSTLGAFDFGVEVPSTALRPESSRSYEAGLRVARASFSGSALVYRTNLNDLIDRVPSEFLGQAVFEGQRVYRRENVGRAHVQGAEIEGAWDPGAAVRVFAHVTYTYGKQHASGEPMRRIPPLHGALGARVAISPRVSLDAMLRAAGRQDRLAPGDLSDHRIAKGGTPGWALFDVSAAARLWKGLDVSAGVHNAFDEAYRVHGSGIDGSGRALWVATRARF